MLISIILPVFNAEKTVASAINSVIKQDFSDWELIIIEDHSSDNSLKIVNGFSKKDSRIKVICNSENLGPAISRNIGLENAKGKYIGFIDADDTYHKNFISTMISHSEINETEIVWCNYFNKTSKKEERFEISTNITRNQVYSSRDAVSFFFSYNQGLGSVWNKIYLRDFLEKNNLKFNPLRTRAEDWEFNLYAFSRVNRMIRVDDCLYYYIHQNMDSVMSIFRPQDYYLIWRSIDLLNKINDSFNLNQTLKYIYELNSLHLIEFFYKSSISGTYRETIGIFKEKRFLEFITLIDIENLPKTYRILSNLIKKDLWRLAFLFCRFSNSYQKILKS